jgi:hypothetical protein
MQVLQVACYLSAVLAVPHPGGVLTCLPAALSSYMDSSFLC